MAREYVKLGTPVASGERLSVPLECSPGVAPYLKEGVFWADYGPENDLSEVPEAILAIPAVGNLAAVAWALGADLRVGALDARYARALDGIGATVKRIYPKLKVERARLVVDRPEEIDDVDAGRVGLLFSGGLDSNVTLIEHRARVTDLFTVWGADVPLRDEPLWRRLDAHVRSSPLAAGTVKHFVASNLRSVLNNDRLVRDFGSFMITGSWWGGVQVGLGLQSLVAPAAYRRGLGTVMEASSLTAVPGETFIFSPDVDEQIVWAGSRVVHDGFHRTRQEKIRDVLAPFVRQGNEVPLAVCYAWGRGAGPSLNCGLCEKCVRTQVGLLLEGIDPNACGFRTTADALDEVVAGFAAHRYRFDPVTTAVWVDLQRLIPADLDRLPDVAGSRRFFAWLRAFDVSAYERRAFLANQPFLRARLVTAGAPLLRTLPRPVRRRLREAWG